MIEVWRRRAPPHPLVLGAVSATFEDVRGDNLKIGEPKCCFYVITYGLLVGLTLFVITHSFFCLFFFRCFCSLVVFVLSLLSRNLCNMPFRNHHPLIMNCWSLENLQAEYFRWPRSSYVPCITTSTRNTLDGREVHTFGGPPGAPYACWSLVYWFCAVW